VLKTTYTSKDLAIIIPTKDRPEKIKDLLNSITIQNVQCRRIIIVDGGESIKDIILSYKKLPIEYYSCDTPGQIIQRNLALSKLTDGDKLVAFFDDDLVLMPESIKCMINMWNKVEKETAGISFNIINNPPVKHNLLKSFIGMSNKKMGAILRSGYNVPISPTEKNIKTEWLCGGATVWRQRILKTYINQDIQSRWAVCEDIIFSYPISKHYSLYVCADAKVRHEHVYDHNVKIDHKYYGRTSTLWGLHFVEQNKTLSRLYYFYMISAQILIRFCMGICLIKKDKLDFAIGQVLALNIAIKTLVKKRKILSLLEEE
jgi:glycosyltransferase involved in cell wall biosynthesis